MAFDSVSSLDGSTFVISDRCGDIRSDLTHSHGLYFRDTRHLSGWRLTLEGKDLEVLSTDDVEYFSSQFFLVPPTGTIYQNPSISVVRQRFVGDGLHEDVIVLNHSRKPVRLKLRIDVEADFADLFEVKDRLAKKGGLYQRVAGKELILGYRRDDFVRETCVRTTGAASVSSDGLAFEIDVRAHGRWETCLIVVPETSTVHPDHHSAARHRVPKMEKSLDEWLSQAPALDTDWDVLHHIYRRSLVDLAALRFYPELRPDASVPAAGLPWFMALFGRDSLITSYQALPFASELAETTLRVLASRQGKVVDDFRDEEPGRILHELRVGELTHFRERPQSPYYGSSDATPLFLILLDEFERWTGDRTLVGELEQPARAALDWIDRYGDRDGDGYVEYQRRNTQTGLENQCWKDSWNSILHRDGSLASLPRATCEVQGYVYDAKVRCARLARAIWDDAALADRLEREAADLRARFNRDFWIADRGYFALALDGAKHQVGSLTSNIGHLLWSGIVDDDKVHAVVTHLMGNELYSGWGVRTMASGEGGFNPIEYHNGTVWPHDNSLIVAGLWRYGRRHEAQRIARDLLEAATYFQHRLPEVFAGYPREFTHFPVEYPTASSPQAWATATPLLLMRAILGLQPEGERLTVDPHLPRGIGHLALSGVAGRWGRTDVVARRTG